MSNMHRLNNIVTFKVKDLPPIGFHSESLEIAEISNELYNSIVEQKFNHLEVQQEFSLWDQIEPSNSFEKKTAKIQSLTINITQLCNLHCTYCAAGGDGTFGDPVKKISVEKTIPQINFFLNKLENEDSFTISFLGGEPLLYPESILLISEYVKNYDSLKKIKVKFHITTNGTLLNDPILDVLKKIKPDITISLDGPKEVNDFTRPNKRNQGVTDLVQKNLEQIILNKAYFGSIGISGVYNTSNLKVFESYLYFKSFDVDWFEFNFDHNCHEKEASNIFLGELKKVAQEAYLMGGEKELKKIKTFAHFFKTLENQQKIHNFCGAGKSMLMIDARNNIYPCPWMVGDKEEQIGEDLHISQLKLDTFQPSIIETNNCHQCWAKFICGGGCMYIHKSHTGSKYKVSSTFCERTRATIQLSIEFFFRSRSDYKITQ